MWDESDDEEDEEEPEPEDPIDLDAEYDEDADEDADEDYVPSQEYALGYKKLIGRVQSLELGF